MGNVVVTNMDAAVALFQERFKDRPVTIGMRLGETKGKTPKGFMFQVRESPFEYAITVWEDGWMSSGLGRQYQDLPRGWRATELERQTKTRRWTHLKAWAIGAVVTLVLVGGIALAVFLTR